MAEPLPTPMLSEQFVDEFIEHTVTAKPGDHVGIVAMQLSAQVERDESMVYQLLESIMSAKERDVRAEVIVDGRYVQHMTRIGNRDYPDYLPLANENQRSERAATRTRTNTWLEELRQADVLVERHPQQLARGYVPRLRQLGSLHIAQRLFAVVHSKAAFSATAEGDFTAWLNMGNLTDSDLRMPSDSGEIGMNNVIMRTHGRTAAFIIQAVTSGFSPEAGTHSYGDLVKMVHDTGNYGEPARLPTILSEALMAIDPRRDNKVRDPYHHTTPVPKAVLLLSQYAPNGMLANALTHAARQGAYVSVPLQPDTDYRSRNFPYNLNNALFKTRAIGHDTEKRAVPSHIKALIVTYHDGTAKLILGTDNFVTNIQKVVRNEEIAVVLSVDTKDPEEADYFIRLVDLLHDIGEVSGETRRKLLDNVNN